MNKKRSPLLHPRSADLTGHKSGMLTVVSFAGYRKTGKKFEPFWNCECQCGGRSAVRAANLSGLTQSCGCLRRTPKMDLTGTRFERWRVIGLSQRQDFPGGAKKWLWSVVCDCGSTAEVTGGSLKSGLSKSCGCLRGEKIAASNRKRRKPASKHKKLHPLYSRASAIINRCLNPKCAGYDQYGGREINGPWLPDEWKALSATDLAIAIENLLGLPPSPNHSLDRIDNDKGYVPGNLRWATFTEQVANRRPYVVLNRDGRRVYRKFRTNKDLARWILDQPEGRLAIADLRRKARRSDSDESDQGRLPIVA